MEFKLYDRKFKLINYDLFSFYKKGSSKEEKWHYVKLSLNNEGYKVFGFTVDGKRKNIKFHRVVYYAYNPTWNFYDNSNENYIDHFDAKDYPKNHPKNNHIENLSVMTAQENQFNTRARGCSFHKARGKYQAQIRLNNKLIHIGYYDTEQEAHQAYLAKKAELHVIRAR